MLGELCLTVIDPLTHAVFCVMLVAISNVMTCTTPTPIQMNLKTDDLICICS